VELFATLHEHLIFGPASAFAGDVLRELEREPTDAVAIDFLLYGAHAAAERSGLPTAALHHTVYAPPTIEVPPFGPGLGLPRCAAEREAHQHGRAQRIQGWELGLSALNAARESIGLPPLGSVFEQLDRLDRVLVMTSAAFDFAAIAGAALPANVVYVGPQAEVDNARSDVVDQRLPPIVLVSFSTAVYEAQQKVVPRIAAALGTLPVRGLITTGPMLELEGRLPSNVEVRDWVPHAEILPHAALVVTHAGMGTTMASLAHGVPLVCVPMGTDQYDVSARVVHAGAGVRLDVDADTATIAATIRAALADPDLKAAAARLAHAIREEIVADRGVLELEALAR
jgi:MGT family glycosyltransferase